jgi:hypothetical protein
MFVKAEVSKICAKSLFKFDQDFVNQVQKKKIKEGSPEAELEKMTAKLDKLK